MSGVEGRLQMEQETRQEMESEEEYHNIELLNMYIARTHTLTHMNCYTVYVDNMELS